MIEIKRFNFYPYEEHGNVEHAQESDGDYVLYTDYQAAQTKIKELEAEVKRLNDKYDFQLLVKRIKKLEQANRVMREALEGISKTNISGSEVYSAADYIVNESREALAKFDKQFGEEK